MVSPQPDLPRRKAACGVLQPAHEHRREVAADTIDSALEIVRSQPPGRIDVDEITRDPDAVWSHS